ncbi:serine/threonine-protein kinase mph1-like [Camellia sinensis]|uniref:serine/threonine-protein kinase mph1-like n=1 Tax=Camellia sinensis TaxID=4442 RepID=UPI0010368A24|nr:serine/threonine-protein kinase mph1-like [Camellia sinensis]
MDGEANLPPPPPPSGPTRTNLLRPTNPDSNLSRSFTSTSSSSSSSSSSFYSSSPPQGFLCHVQAAFKRHRPLGMTQSNNIRPRRILVAQRGTSKQSASNLGPTVDQKETQDKDRVAQTVNTGPVVNEYNVDASITPPSMPVTITNTYEECAADPFDIQQDQPKSFADNKHNDIITSSLVESQHVPLADGQNKVHFSVGNNAGSLGADDQMATGTDNLLSHMGSLSLTEMEWDDQPSAATAISHDLKQQNLHNIAADVSLRSDGPNCSLLAKTTIEHQDQLHQFRNTSHGDLSHPMTQSSVAGLSCATTTLVNSVSAPMLNSTAYYSHPHQNSRSNVDVESLRDHNVSSQPIKEFDLPKELQGSEPKESDNPKDPSPLDDKGKGLAGDATDLPSQASLSKNLSSDVKLEPSKSGKQEKIASGKVAPHKRNYDPALFLKVNGKLYQRLGKIGSGGSSEVHKVISSDCTIYALKKIKLKGRDYATAYGFCQEIEYLNKLKGMNNIIQLIDSEVTDKTLLQEVMSNKDGRVKEDGYIYMVLEYGEIDLAHMLSQKWKEMEGTNLTIDENWLRFYWQQILLAVNTIHEERIVHSDLKPANFLLVRGSLKLIDFGIAKAIMSDTTNIQRDSQVGTLSYMSPEAFMCNETDANGNTIKCGRASDIWSLGCILYQMVYGRTPFSEYKTFWAKFKVITDPNHEITYEPVSNPWLVDLMKKCLAWDRNERWRIPQLLQHPFLVPPIPPQLSWRRDQNCKLLQLIVESCANNQKALMLYGQLEESLMDPRPALVSQLSTSLDQQRKLLCEISQICFQLREQLADQVKE